MALKHSQTLPDIQDLVNEINALKSERQKLKKLYRKYGLTGDKIIIHTKGAKPVVKINDIQAVKTDKKQGLEIFVKSGSKYQTRRTYDLKAFEKILKNYPQFVRTHKEYIVNMNHLDYFEPSTTEFKAFMIGLRHTGLKVPLSVFNSEKVKAYFNIKTLEHVTPWNQQYQAIIDENLREFAKEIRLMTKEELLENFKYESTGEFNIKEFMGNMIWEYYRLMQTGDREPIDGNIRTFWYIIKPTLSKVIKINSQAHYLNMISVFKRLAVTHGLFKYKEFGFTSEKQDMYKIGETHPDIFFVGEKAGHFKKIQKIAQEFGTSVISLGGSPSILTTEYLVDELEKLVNLKEKQIHFITLVDYDPAGAIIARTFIEQLLHEGVQNIGSISHLLIPSNFPPEEIEHITEPVPMETPADKTKVEKWLQAGGGVNGQPLGIESEALMLDFEKLRNLFKIAFDNILKSSDGKTDISGYDTMNMDLKGIKVNFFNM